MTVTVLLIGVLAAVAVPKYGAMHAEYQVRMAAERVAADLRMAREEAIANSAGRSVVFQSDAIYTISGMADLNNPAIPYRVDLTSTPYSVHKCVADFDSSQSIVFNGHGIPNRGGRVTIVSTSGQVVVVVDHATGEASVQ